MNKSSGLIIAAFFIATLRNVTRLVARCCPPSLSICISLNIFLCFRSRNPDVEATAGGCGGHQLPGHPGPEHQQEVPVDVLEGDLGPHPGVAVRALLGDAHLARLPPVGPRQHRQLVAAPV